MGYKDCTISNELRTSLGLSPESIVFIVLLSYFQTLTSYELLVLSSNFFWPLKKVCFQTEILGKFVSIYIFCFILLFTSSSSCRKDQLPFYIFLQVVILPVQVYIWEIRHHSLVCRCGLSDILYILVFFFKLYFQYATSMRHASKTHVELLFLLSWSCRDLTRYEARYENTTTTTTINK